MDKNTPTSSIQPDLEVLTTEQAAAIIGVKKRTMDNWRSLGRGPAYIKLNKRRIGYLRGDTLSFIQKHRIEPQG